MKIKINKLKYLLFISNLSLISISAHALSLDAVSFMLLPDDRTQIRLQLSETLKSEPYHFTIDEPNRVAIDLPSTTLNLNEKSKPIGMGVADSFNAIESAGRTRVVVNLTESVPYQIDTQGSNILLTLENSAASLNAAANGSTFVDYQGSIEGVDFRRGDNGEGLVIVNLSDSSVPVDIGFEGGKVRVNFIDAYLPADLDRKLDVTDFATLVKDIDTTVQDNVVKMLIGTTSPDYDYSVYQTENQYIVEFKPLTDEQIAEQREEGKGYTGEKLSLIFQNIEIRAILQLIADFTGLNMVVSDTVAGNITLRLKNVPWDQALDIVLKSRGLAMRESGNVIMVAPSEEISARERLELEALRQAEELEPLRTEFMQVNYANANDLMALIQVEQNNLLSERGTIAIDARTNTLIVQDTIASLSEIKNLVDRLDVPIRQVLIESRIVNADETFAKDVGVRFGVSRSDYLNDSTRNRNRTGYTIGGGNAGNVNFGGTTAFNNGGNENLIVDLPANAASAASLGFAVGKVGSWLLQLELSALIAEGRGENIASPRVITANQNEALIESGVQIPYQEASSSGATSTSFQDAVLSLRVTPQITPDDRIIMDLNVSQDTVSGTVVNGVPAINTRNVATQVLVENGETVVLGGVYTSSDRKAVDKAPFFGDLPYVGFLFRRTDASKEKNELLIFITPKILRDSVNI